MNTITNIILTVTVSLLIISAYHLQFARDTPRIITIDVNQLIEAKVRSLTLSGNEESSNKQAITRYGKQLEQLIQNLSQESNVVVLPSQAVLAGGTDYTEQFKRGFSLQ